MSKAAQRRKTAASLRKKRYEHGKQQAEIQKSEGYIISWYPHCMAWRAGFLQAGGWKFW